MKRGYRKKGHAHQPGKGKGSYDRRFRLKDLDSILIRAVVDEDKDKKQTDR